jgi:hypothetical protein
MEKEEIRNNETGYIKLSKNETLKGIKYNWEIKVSDKYLIKEINDANIYRLDLIEALNKEMLTKFPSLEF